MTNKYPFYGRFWSALLLGNNLDIKKAIKDIFIPTDIDDIYIFRSNVDTEGISYFKEMFEYLGIKHELITYHESYILKVYL